MGFLFLCLDIFRFSKGQWQELVILCRSVTDCVFVRVFPYGDSFVISSLMHACLSSALIILPTGLVFYIILVFVFLSIAAPRPPGSVQKSWIDPLNWCLMKLYSATVILRNSLSVSNPPPKTPILHWSCSVCTKGKALCMPVMCFTATADSGNELILTVQTVYSRWMTDQFILY